MGEIFTDEEDKRVFVISNDVICEIDNIENIQTKNVNVMLTNIKSTSGCNYFLAEGEILQIIPMVYFQYYLYDIVYHRK